MIAVPFLTFLFWFIESSLSNQESTLICFWIFTIWKALSWKFPMAWNSWKTLSFHQIFGSKEDPTSHLWNVQNKNFSLISKYHLSINFITQKWLYFHLLKDQKKNFSVISKHGIPCYRRYHLIIFWERKDHQSWLLIYHASFINTKGRSFFQLLALKKICFCSQKFIVSTFSSSKILIIWTFSFV